MAVVAVNLTIAASAEDPPPPLRCDCHLVEETQVVAGPVLSSLQGADAPPKFTYFHSEGQQLVLHGICGRRRGRLHRRGRNGLGTHNKWRALVLQDKDPIAQCQVLHPPGPCLAPAWGAVAIGHC